MNEFDDLLTSGLALAIAMFAYYVTVHKFWLWLLPGRLGWLMSILFGIYVGGMAINETF